MKAAYGIKAGDFVRIGKSRKSLFWEVLGIKTHLPKLNGETGVIIKSENKIVRTVSVFAIKEVRA